MEVERVPINSLKPHPRNPRQGDIGAISESLKAHGQYRPIVAQRSTSYILAGNHTWKAARALKWKDIATVFVDVSDDEAYRILLVDNRSGDLADYDNNELVTLLQELTATELGLEGTGYDGGALDELLRDLGLDEEKPDPAPQMDRAAELREQWGTERGQVWAIPSKSVPGRSHRLMCGDSTSAEDVARLMGGEKAAAVLTDPPYGIDQPGVTNDAPELQDGLVRGAVGNLPVDNAVVVAFQSTRTFPLWLDAIRAAGHEFQRMLWMYKAAQCTFPWRGWILKSESILVSSVGNPEWQDAHPYSHDCYYLPEVSGELKKDSGWHGSVKPLAVVTDLARRIAPEGITLYDPFLGSGTTMVAAENERRVCYGMEIDPGYCAVILQRMTDMGLAPHRVTRDEKDG